MRTKSLCLAAAVLAGGVLAASAQGNVYSLNIVGYVNVVYPPGLTLTGNPLNAGTNNTANGLMPAALPNKSQIITFNGTSYTPYGKSAGAWPALNLPTGTGFFVNNAGATPVTNTLVGEVGPSGTYAGGTNTQSIPLGFSLVTTPLPIGGNITSTGPNTINLAASLPNKAQVITFTPPSTYTPFGKSAGAFPSVPLAVGQGFYINTPSAGSNWVQIITP
jgi:hypothetical protein